MYRQLWFFGLKMMVGQFSRVEPLHVFTGICFGAAQKLNSTFASTFSVYWQHVPKSQLNRFLTKEQLGLKKQQKLSYAAVTLGQGVATSPIVNKSVSQSMVRYSAPLM